MNNYLNELRMRLELIMDSSLGSSPTRHSGKPEAISEQLALLRAHFERPVSASAGDPAVGNAR